MQATVLTLAEVAARLKVSEATIRRAVTSGAFPKPFMTGARCPRWSVAAIEAHERGEAQK